LLFTGFVVPGTAVKSSRKTRAQRHSDAAQARELSRAKDR
jgi:hypothetical protein